MSEPALLACENCSRRKTKCDKLRPQCSRCKLSGLVCTPVIRTRRARGRNGGRQGGATEIRDRISRLERLVQSIGDGIPSGAATQPNGQDGGDGIPPSLANGLPTMEMMPVVDTTGQTHLSERSSPLSSNEGGADASHRINRWTGSTLFAQLSEEITGICEILDSSNDDETEPTETPNSNLAGAQQNISTTRTLFAHSPPQSAASHLPIPGPHDIEFLLTAIRERVTPIVKVLHTSTFEAGVRESMIAKSSWSVDPNLEAVHAAAFYAAICSLHEDECTARFGIAKLELLKSWRMSVEERLARSNFLVSERLETLQALILYLVASNSHDSSRLTWTLLPIAIRIAQVLNLHREESLASLPVLEAHIRRCIWHTLNTLDFQVAMARGSDTIISERGSNTKYPLCIDDSQISAHTTIPPAPPSHYTDMTFFCLGCECSTTVRYLNFVEPGDLDRPPSLLQYSWEARQDAVSKLEARIEEYVVFCNDNTPAHNACRSLAKLIVATMRLYVVRPLQRHPAMKPPKDQPINFLRLATDALAETLAMIHGNNQWSWYGRQFVNWHPLAVLLAELSVAHNDASLVAEAWTVAERAYSELSGAIAEGPSGPLWLPIKKLMRGAQARRQGLLAPHLPTLPEMGNGADKEAFVHQHDLLASTAPYIPPHTHVVNDPFAMTISHDAAESWSYWDAFIDNLGVGNGADVMVEMPIDQALNGTPYYNAAYR